MSVEYIFLIGISAFIPPPLCADLRYTLVVVVMFLASSLLCPVLWYLWIHAGSANANFFFAMTLTYSLAQVSNRSHYEPRAWLAYNYCFIEKLFQCHIIS